MTLPYPVRALACGVLAGFFTLGIDQLLAFLTLGYSVPMGMRDGLAYLCLAAFVALVFITVFRALKRRLPAPVLVFGITAAGIYAPAIFERVYHALVYRIAPLPAIVAAALAVGAYGVWIAVMERVGGQRANGLAPLLGAIGGATGLAVNRNLVDFPLEPAALAADAAVLGGALALAYLGRVRGSRQALIATGAIAVLTLTLSVATRGGKGETTPVTGESSPNLVLVIIDTLRQDVFKDVVRKTKEGKAFRRELEGSAWFNRAIAASPWTVPSVGSIMTGLYPREHGFQAAPMKDPGRPLRPLAKTVPTLAQKLSQLGYRTEAIGTNPLMQPVSGIARGFDHYEILSGPTVKLPPLTALARVGLLRVDNYQPAASVGRRLKQRLDRIPADGRPLFLWLHLMDPHSPLKKHRGLSTDPRVAELDEQRALYRDEVRYSLRELKRMFRMLKARDLWQNTALVVVSDHGEMFPADGHNNGVKTLDGSGPKLYGHGHAMYGELVRVPLVIRPPGGLPKHRQVKVLTSHVDLHDTILDLLGLDLPRTGRDRVSLAPWLTTEPPETQGLARERVLISANQHGPRQRALRTRKHKLIDYPKSRRSSELYEITSDPRERRDMADTRKGLVARLQQQLERKWEGLSEAPESAPAELDAETLKKLKALGYVP